MQTEFPNKTLSADHGGGPRGQGGAQQGTGARGEQYLDGGDRSHTLARRILFEPSSAFKLPSTINKIPLNNCPFFRSKRRSKIQGSGCKCRTRRERGRGTTTSLPC